MAEPYVYRGGVYRDNAALREWLAGQEPEPVLNRTCRSSVRTTISGRHRSAAATCCMSSSTTSAPATLSPKAFSWSLTLWNAFKRIAAGASADEKTALFSGTAAEVYRLN
jgi:hypothetical protein